VTDILSPCEAFDRLVFNQNLNTNAFVTVLQKFYINDSQPGKNLWHQSGTEIYALNGSINLHMN